MTVLSLQNVNKSFNNVVAIDDLTLEIEHGEIFGFLGPNGAGKTTTIGVITGQTIPDSGTVTVLGTNPATNPVETRKLVGIQPERETPPSLRTVLEYFTFVGKVRGIEKDVLEERIIEWADRFNMHPYLNTYCGDLSAGQQQAVMIAQAFLSQPELVIIDEPLVNLDPQMQERAKEYFVSYKNKGNTLILSTHHVAVAEEICSRVGIIENGSLVSNIVPSELETDSLLDIVVNNIETQDKENATPTTHEN